MTAARSAASWSGCRRSPLLRFTGRAENGRHEHTSRRHQPSDPLLDVFRLGDRVLDQLRFDRPMTRAQALEKAMQTTRVSVCHDCYGEGWMGYLAKLEHAEFIVSLDPFGSQPVDLSSIDFGSAR